MVTIAGFENAFEGRRVFLTGHTGFKGSWMAIWLESLGAEVTGYALAPPTAPSNFEVSGVRELLADHHEADLRDKDALENGLRSSQPDVIFHMAAQPLVRLSYEEPAETWEVNVMGTINLLQAVRKIGRPCTVVVVTSDKCYENREHVWGYRECDAMGGFDPYSASKGATELAVASWRRSFFNPQTLNRHGVKVATARAGNVIGGGDWAKDRIVTDMVLSLAKGQAIPVRNPEAIRPWQHVLEPLSGYLALAAKMMQSDDPIWCDGWNFGPVAGEEATVRELVKAFLAEWQGSWEDQSHDSHPHEARILRLAIEKAGWHLKWRPRWHFEETVRRTAAWYRKYYEEEGASMLEACREDIRAYSAKEPIPLSLHSNP